MKPPKKTGDSKVVTANDATKKRNRKKVDNLKGTESGMKKGSHANEQPEH